jgi:Fe-S-cluster containining protein
MTAHKHKKAVESTGPDRATLLKETARQILAENGEKPDHWLIAATESAGKLTFLCASPPFAVTGGYAGPLLDQVLANNLSLTTYLTLKDHQYEGVACASFGFLAPALAEASSWKAAPEEFPPDVTRVFHLRHQADPLLALRVAMGEMLRLGYGCLKTPFEPQWSANPQNPAGQPLALIVKPDGSLAFGAFEPQTTLGRFSSILSAAAGRAKLTRLRQSAQDCGGCGRCCHDSDIPLTYFDLGGLAGQRFPALFDRQPVAARAEVQANFTLSKAAAPAESPLLVTAKRLTLRKKDGTGGEGSPCAFLDARGLCSVYEGRPLLCRLYHCAKTSTALETLYYSVYYNLEWLGRAVESGFLTPAEPITLALLFEQPLGRLASPAALSLVAQEMSQPKANLKAPSS